VKDASQPGGHGRVRVAQPSRAARTAACGTQSAPGPGPLKERCDGLEFQAGVALQEREDIGQVTGPRVRVSSSGRQPPSSRRPRRLVLAKFENQPARFVFRSLRPNSSVFERRLRIIRSNCHAVLDRIHNDTTCWNAIPNEAVQAIRRFKAGWLSRSCCRLPLNTARARDTMRKLVRKMVQLASF
jgi:hypothetical protein